MATTIDLTNGQPVFKTLVESESTLADAYVVSVQADSAADKIRGATQGVFGVMRYNLVQLYMRALAAAKSDKSKLNVDAIFGDFLVQCEDAESQFDLPSTATSRTWTQAKSDLKAALLMGYPFDENQECGATAMKKWCKQVRDNEKKKEEEAAMEAARKRRENAANDSGKSASSSEPSQPVSQSGNTGTDTSKPDLFSGLTEEQQKVVLDTINKLAEINKTDHKKADNILKSFSDTVAASFKKVLAKLAA